MGEVFVPITGESVDRTSDTGGWENGRWRPANHSRRASLHDIHLRPSPAPEETPPAQIEIPQTYTPTFDPQPQVGYTQGDNAMAGNNQQPRGPKAPNPFDFDLYDEESAAAFQRANDEYIESKVQAALAPSRQAVSDAELVAQYNRTVSKYADDANFKPVMDEALQACARDARAGKPVNIEQAYERTSEAVSGRSGQRSAHLPSKARTVAGLGALIDFNHKSGRAKPFPQKRGW